jgi:predicted PilT family ATPase
VSKEIMANIIILGWPQRSDIFEKIIGEKTDTILNNTDKTTFLCDFEKPLVLNKKIVVAVPPLAEREQGFEHWLSKIATIAQELTIPIEFHCNSNTKYAIEKVSKLVKFSAEIITINFDDWEDFIIVARYIHEDDLFVLVSARKGSVSYMNLLDGLPVKLGKYFTANSKIIIYPQQNVNEYIDDNYDEFSTEPLTRGIEAVQKIGKGIANIFKKDNNG